MFSRAGWRIFLGLGIHALLLAPSLLMLGSVARASGTECRPAWRVVASPNSEYPGNIWNDVTVISPEDAWVVGKHWGVVSPGTMMAHWDGRKWKRVPSPNPGDNQQNVWDVAHVSSDDVWAVGYYSMFEPDTTEQALVLHWNGTVWEHVAAPEIQNSNNHLRGLAALAMDDIWAVGSSYGQDGSDSLIMHWDGDDWSVIPSPNPGSYANFLAAASGVAADDIWAVGTLTEDGGQMRTLALHYDGDHWSVVSTPVPGDSTNYLTDVYAIASHDVWAVGMYVDDKGLTKNLTIHWDGTMWSMVQVPTPNSSGYYTPLNAVTANGSDDVWTVGHIVAQQYGFPLTLNWQGSKWKRKPIETVGTNTNHLYGLDTAGVNDIWAAGHYYLIGSNSATLIQHWGSTIADAKAISPAKNAVVTQRRVLLDWRDLGCADRYEVVVRQSNADGPVVFERTDVTASHAKTPKLTKGTKYVWSVRGCNADGCGFWSKWRSFQIAP